MDICMCMSKNCVRREECYRAQAVPDRLQTYSDFEELCKNNDFEYFWEMKKTTSFNKEQLDRIIFGE